MWLARKRYPFMKRKKIYFFMADEKSPSRTRLRPIILITTGRFHKRNLHFFFRFTITWYKFPSWWISSERRKCNNELCCKRKQSWTKHHVGKAEWPCKGVSERCQSEIAQCLKGWWGGIPLPGRKWHRWTDYVAHCLPLSGGSVILETLQFDCYFMK